MPKKHLRDFTQGSILKHLLIFSIPMFLGNLLQALYNTVDSIWVGRFLGANALGAVSVSFPIIFGLIALVMGLTMATTTLVAQYYGAGDMERVRRTIVNSLVLLTVMGLAVSAIGVIYRGPLLHLINTPAEIFAMSSDYLGIFFAGLIGIFLYNVISAILRGLGDSRTPLIFLVYATVINIVLDPLFIFGVGPLPRMGVAGAALATILAQGVAAYLALRYLWRSKDLLWLEPGFWKLDRDLTAKTFKVGLPTGLQQMVVSFSALAVSAVVNRFGAVVVAGFGAGSRLDQFAFMPALSVGFAVSALVGQNLGAGREDRVKDTIFWSSLLSAVITGVVATVAIFWPRLLLGLFTADEAVLQAGSQYLRYMGVAYIPLALMFIVVGVLRGAGDTVATMFLTALSLWAVRIPLAYYLASRPELGVRGVWMAIAISAFASLLMNYLYYKTERWKTKVLVQRPLVPETEGGADCR